MITEYYVLNALSEGRWLTADEIAPSPEWDDRWATHRLLETLENAGLVESLRSHDNANSYHISITGQYRLQQLRERQECELKTISLLNELNKKLDQEREDRIASDRQVVEEASKQQRIERHRFAFNTVVGIVSAIAAVIGAIFAALSFFS